jgi:hypothetical protein
MLGVHSVAKSTSLAHVQEEEEFGVGGGLWFRLEALLGWRIRATLLNPLRYIFFLLPFFLVANKCLSANWVRGKRGKEGKPN